MSKTRIIRLYQCLIEFLDGLVTRLIAHPLYT